MYFQNRTQAAHQLATALEKFRPQHPLILAIPRGAVPMAKVIADELHTDLDIILVRKLGAPNNPEYALGAVGEFGDVYITDVAKDYGFPQEYYDEAIARERDELTRRRESFSAGRRPANPNGRVVIIVDDGIATGSTMISAVRSIRSQNPAKVIVAAPVASSPAARLLAREADELVILDISEDFFAVGEFYAEFTQVTDEEVVQLLSTQSTTRAA